MPSGEEEKLSPTAQRKDFLTRRERAWSAIHWSTAAPSLSSVPSSSTRAGTLPWKEQTLRKGTDAPGPAGARSVKQHAPSG